MFVKEELEKQIMKNTVRNSQATGVIVYIVSELDIHTTIKLIRMYITH